MLNKIILHFLVISLYTMVFLMCFIGCFIAVATAFEGKDLELRPDDCTISERDPDHYEETY